MIVDLAFTVPLNWTENAFDKAVSEVPFPMTNAVHIVLLRLPPVVIDAL